MPRFVLDRLEREGGHAGYRKGGLANECGPHKEYRKRSNNPLIGLVQDLLRNRRERVKPNASDYVFAGTRNGTPLDLHNLANRVIIPAIEKCVVCRLPKIEHEANGHAFQLDKTIHWEGWHGFRRGPATNLLAIGTTPATIAKILRHSDPRITLAFYAKANENESGAAMHKLERHVRNLPSGMLVGGPKA